MTASITAYCAMPASGGNRHDVIGKESRLFTPRERLNTSPLVRFACGLRWVCLVFACLELQTIAVAAPWPAKLLRRLVAPFRSNAFLQSRTTPCSLGFTNCFLPGTSPQLAHRIPEPEHAPVIEEPSRIVLLQRRALHGGPFAHHWLEIENSTGRVALGFGPATVPFIDAGQVSLQDRYGNVERISGMHPLLVLGPPPLKYRYAKAPGTGHAIGKPIQLTAAQADALVQRLRHSKFVSPYVPIFHDCRTFVCAVEAAAQGRSSLPCYLLFKGYW
jgi:hypothetical protein